MRWLCGLSIMIGVVQSESGRLFGPVALVGAGR